MRTIDGKKLKLKINLSITVSQFAALVASNSVETASPFSLSAGYPPKDLTDGDATVEAAGLKGAAITQKCL